MISGASTGAPTGGRVTRKIRATVARHPELGGLLHVESNTPPAGAYLVTAGVILVFATGIVLGNGDLVDALVVAPIWAVLAALVLWFIGSEKLLVLQGGILVGSFAPFLHPSAVTYAEVDARSVDAVDRFTRIPRMTATNGVSATGRGALWSRYAVVFVQQPSVAAPPRPGAPEGRAAQPPRRAALRWFATKRHPDALVQALDRALDRAGAPGAAGVAARALPATVLSGRPEDVLVQLPGLRPYLR
ncbi:hypothetical protein [Cellulosimicrobium arenosum]|uniref:Uncharacterized protein n=1 Tax=Cellulosimicrobium arenosum TaxID=2708133 RepID=A0A927J191_9MICO|nr:hypothetical protein [Cellulosimicrobium arenosum]MBD8080034.1 hypothetical protein [Cellulosimicrobium arenosum]